MLWIYQIRVQYIFSESPAMLSKNNISFLGKEKKREIIMIKDNLSCAVTGCLSLNCDILKHPFSEIMGYFGFFMAKGWSFCYLSHVKNQQCSSKYPTVSSLDCFKISKFKSGHPVITKTFIK